ncbi:MAG TPA: hypothetical protein DCE71_06510, partial [Parachlamydiales bacterium]|nr:hypothetical protein [Parachlamydiales bacterium]
DEDEEDDDEDGAAGNEGAIVGASFRFSFLSSDVDGRLDRASVSELDLLICEEILRNGSKSGGVPGLDVTLLMFRGESEIPAPGISSVSSKMI